MRRRRAWRCNENLLLLQRDAMESNLWSVFLIENLQCVLKGEYSANHYTAVPVCLPPHENINAGYFIGAVYNLHSDQLTLPAGVVTVRSLSVYLDH